ncbi:uncharacterized protein LOC117103435 isoform X2 [Anneissia japonica]|uniref:uncharacterized protein LOC117103435 isoform X2 n=1 Tax=Anneissia japonica TaxID=1529436 RepID=UPI0014258A8D|nr:uncharacterized protein LOC117103435 isoform X2 [Anneissia japonica]
MNLQEIVGDCSANDSTGSLNDGSSLRSSSVSSTSYQKEKEKEKKKGIWHKLKARSKVKKRKQKHKAKKENSLSESTNNNSKPLIRLSRDNSYSEADLVDLINNKELKKRLSGRAKSMHLPESGDESAYEERYVGSNEPSDIFRVYNGFLHGSECRT